jgi:Aldo/keto reductase family
VDYRPLGRTGVQVSKLCLGTMMLGAWGNTDHDDSIRIVHRALDAGVNFVDTADVYSAGESEEIVGKALKGRRDDVVLATKVSVPMDEDPNHRGNSRRWIITEVGPHRRDRPPGRDHQPRRHQLRRAGARAVPAATLAGPRHPADGEHREQHEPREPRRSGQECALLDPSRRRSSCTVAWSSPLPGKAARALIGKLPTTAMSSSSPRMPRGRPVSSAPTTW